MRDNPALMEDTGSSPHRLWALAAAGTGLVSLAVYVTLIIGQGDQLWDVFPWAALMVIPPLLSLIAAFGPSPNTDRTLLLIAAVISGIIGLLAALTIGVLFLIAAVLAAIAWSRVARI